MAARKKALKTHASTSMASIEEQLSQEVAGIQNQIGSVGGNKIKTTDKVFTFPDGTIDPGPIQVVIVDFISRNLFYEGAYDANNPQPPVCFAIDKIVKNLVPSQNASDPQGESCETCAMNEWGSEGRGKACKNTRLLAVMAADATGDDEIMTIEVAPTGIKGFDAYVSTVANTYNKPPIAVVTELSFDPSKSYPKLGFKVVGVNDNLAVHFGKRDEAKTMLESEPDTTVADTKPTRKKPTRRRRRAA